MRNRRLLTVFLLFASSSLPARDKAENWIQVTTPHFTVVTDSGEKQGRRIADQFERMRSLFHTLFPKIQMESTGAPVIVVAVKDEKDFRALEPEQYLAKGSLKLAGYFQQAADKNYVLMRLDADGEHPYSVVYHEYTHFLLRETAEWMPLWLNEGFAEFYQNTEIHEKDASLGEPSMDDIQWLRQNRLLPLTTLLTVDHTSPYYHEENKGSIFYAESWALTHYIMTNDARQKTHRMIDYETLLTQKVDPVAAAAQAFGDIKKLQSDLDNYVQHGSYSYFRMNSATEVDDSVFKVQPLSEAQSDAIRADVLAYSSRMADAQALLDHVLQMDPKNAQAYETKGFLEFRQGHIDEAKKSYGQAVHLDSQSYLAHYYFAAMSMSGNAGAGDQDEVESSLRAAIQLNPKFAPALDRLAAVLTMQHKDLDDARMNELKAVALEPSNVYYRMNMANIFMTKRQPDNAIAVLRAAAKVAKNPAESQVVDRALMNAMEYAQQVAKFSEQKQRWEQVSAANSPETSGDTSIPRLKHREFVAKGPHRFLVGVLKHVECDIPSLDLTVTSKDKQLSLHVENYYKISFTALGFKPDDDLNPCQDLEDRPAKVEYVESADPSVKPEVISVELQK
jgi:tetratricopeptide (TPR) repeat protein